MTDNARMTEEAPRTRFPAQIVRPLASGDGDRRAVVTHDDADAVRAVNRGISSVDDVARRSNPDVTPAPRATGVVTVLDLDRRACHSICLHRVDYRPRYAPAVGEVVVFSDPVFAPGRTRMLQLATPGHYRDAEHLEPGIRDRDDGTLTRDGSRWATSTVGGAVTARLRFASSGEPWVYCASHYRFGSDLRRLRGEFDDRYGYSAATRILDADAFAAWLGVDFALGLAKSADVSLDPLDEVGYLSSNYSTSLWEGSRPIDTFVHVYHGPVNYEDVSGRVDRQEHWFDPNAGPKAWFTKKAAFAGQSEYRFAVSTLGKPVAPRHYIAVSPELRSLTCLV